VFFGQESPNLMIVAVRRGPNEGPAANTNGNLQGGVSPE
jgi:hypothetical protein